MISNLYWLKNEQIKRLRPICLKTHGRPCVDDRRVLSGIIFVNCDGIR